MATPGQDRVERRLAAILAADIAGYSRLMGADEEGTLAALKALRKSLIDPKIDSHRGRTVKTTGDGALVEFASAVDAVRCAMDVQRTMAERNVDIPEDRRIEFRIGINVGDVILDEGDIYGDGVNIAARVETLSQPGAICLSDSAYQQIKGKLALDVNDMGEQRLKNIAEPVRVYSVRLNNAPARPALALPDKPSIAVLPFQNMSGDPEQEYFVDGMAEDIITALSRMRWLFVIARNSSFVYKGRAVDLKQVGRELGVRYVLEGSVRKTANRVRITGQLIDTSTGAHLWADRFDGGLGDVFDLQDHVTTNVVGAIAPMLERAEIERAKRKPTESLDAYDYFLRGMACVHQWSSEANDGALRIFHKAIELDPDFASAYGMASWCYVWRWINRWTLDRAQETAEATRLARRAVDLGDDDAVALSMAGYALVFMAHDLEGGAALIDRALSMNPNLAWAWHSSGWVRDFLGEPDVAIKHLEHGMRLSPLDPFVFRAYAGLACAHLLAGRYDDSSLWAERALQRRPNLLVAIREAAASHALAGRLPEAQKAMAQLRQCDPRLRVSNLKEWLPLRRPQDIARYEEGLRKAGLPE
ncbi:MAG TPA: adenylate/guanylate cyclase domain-containing protein [Alphaproteobacteria bacterium]